MTEPECYDEFATGGKVDKNTTFFSHGCDYIIPKAFAEKWRLELLDRLNEDGVE